MIEGERTRLRPATPDDADQLERWLTDPDVYHFWGGRPHTREEIEAVYTGADPTVAPFIVETDGEAVGYVQHHDQGGIDMFLAPDARGKGLGTDAARAMVRYLVEEKGWRRVTVDPLLTNPRAIAFWFRAGFRPIGGLQTREGPAVLMAWRRVHPWMLKLRDRKVRHKQRHRALRAGWVVLAACVIVVGLLLIPLPGPGWLITAAGVFMLALEFDTAERLLERILDRIEDMTERAQKAGPWAKALLAGLAVAGAVAAVAAVLLWDVPLLPV